MLTKQWLCKYTDMQFLYFCRQNSKTFDVSHAFLPLNVESYKLSKTVHFICTITTTTGTACSF